MLVLKIVFGIIVTLPILVLAEFLFEKTVEDALVGSRAKRRVPFLQRILPKRKGRKDAEAAEKAPETEEPAHDQDPEEWLNKHDENIEEWLEKEIERTSE